MSCTSERARGARAGFTLIELMVVIAVIAILASIGIPTWLHMQKKAAVDSTRTLVNAVATAIASYPMRNWQVAILVPASSPPRYEPRIGRLFDLNGTGSGLGVRMTGDGILDGDPKLENTQAAGSFPDDVIESGYTGFITMTQPPIAKRNVDAGTKRVVDAWKQPLRIAFGADVYGPAGFGIWSIGPDKVQGTRDDITSWESGQHED